MKQNKKVLSVVIPAYNEEENVKPTISEIIATLSRENIPHEIVLVNDNSKDKTPQMVMEMQKIFPQIKLVNRVAPGGFGRALRSGLENFTGDYVVIVMADLSDDPNDIVKYYYKLEEGYDAVFGSRFKKGSKVIDYPIIKLYINRIVNRMIQILFWTEHNDLTNAFKAYQSHVVKSILPLRASHFNITIEISLSTLIRNYKIASIPINWYGRKWGQSNLKLRAMGRRYLATLLKIWFERIFILDDLIAEKSAKKSEDEF